VAVGVLAVDERERHGLQTRGRRFADLSSIEAAAGKRSGSLHPRCR